MRGYNDSRYYAGMFVLAPIAYEREARYVDDHNRAAYEAGKVMAADTNFVARFEDHEYGLSWWSHARFTGSVTGQYNDHYMLDSDGNVVRRD